MADQEFFARDNRFWVDLHQCGTMEAIETVATRINECYRYGIKTLEIIYGTPDIYEGSIQQAMDVLISGNRYVEEQGKVHAGITVTIRQNPNPSPQDENMHFVGNSASYEGRSQMAYEHDYYPFRKASNTGEI